MYKKTLSTFIVASFFLSGCSVTPQKTVKKVTPLPWKSIYGNSIPSNAIVAGHEASPYNQNLYVCRANYKGGLHIGKTRKKFNGCNIGFGGRELTIHNYQILADNNTDLKWIKTDGSKIPNNAIVAGYEASPYNQNLYVCRANYKGGLHIGKTRKKFNGCNIGFGGREITVKYYEVLTGIK
jgi:hypothetical protein